MTKETIINPADLTEQEQAEFISGWEEAGGFMDDCEDNPCPWCCPWYYMDSIVVSGDTPYEWGASWWEACREEAESIRREESMFMADYLPDPPAEIDLSDILSRQEVQHVHVR